MTVKDNEEMQYLETERCHGSTFYYCKVPTTGSCNISTPLRAAFLLQMSHDTSALLPSPPLPGSEITLNLQLYCPSRVQCVLERYSVVYCNWMYLYFWIKTFLQGDEAAAGNSRTVTFNVHTLYCYRFCSFSNCVSFQKTHGEWDGEREGGDK